MSLPKELVDSVLKVIREQNVHWKINGKLEKPTRQQVEQTLDTLAQAVYDGNYKQAMTGGLLVQNNNGHTDVYIYLGEITHDNH